MGRPTKYKKSYPALLEEIISHNGFNTSFCRDVGISEETFYRWVREIPDFRESLKKAKAVSKANFLEKLYGCAFNPAKNPCNNGMVSLLAVNVHGMVTGKEKENTDKEIKTPTLNIKVL